MKIPYLGMFFSFMVERHRIYKKKSDGMSYPWTNDPILREYKFCNVYRELDAGTVWCREHIREPFAEHEALFFNIAAYRSVNNIGTWEDIYASEEKATGIPLITSYDPGRVREAMTFRRSRGERIFTNAHMLTGLHCGDKIVQCTDYTFRVLWDRREELAPTKDDNLQSAFNKLLSAKVPAIGKFLAYEIITDLRHTRYLRHATDIHTWASAGNGAIRGVERVLGVYKKGISRSWDQAELTKIMKEILDASRSYLPDWMPLLEMRDIEHTLCEFDKYERTRTGEGKPRLHYVPQESRESTIPVK